MIVLFWDIDLTLLTTGRAGMLAWDDACRAVAGRPVDLEMKTAGLPDHHVARNILREAGAPETPENISRIVEVYERQLPNRLPARQGRVLEHVREILEHLAGARPDVHSLLLTGNTRDGARAKLRHYGLDQFFEDGAFSRDLAARTEIAARALLIAKSRARGGEPSLFVIGDTPHDVEAGHAIGARTIAVASGVHSQEELQAHGPWRVLSSLPPPREFEQLIDTP